MYEVIENSCGRDVRVFETGDYGVMDRWVRQHPGFYMIKKGGHAYAMYSGGRLQVW